MVTHFLYDITHFDSKFFETLKDLTFKPGFLSKEYMKGKRASYLHPVKMYVFTSAVFFLLFFSLFSAEETFKVNSPEDMTGLERLKELESIEKDIRKDSLLSEQERVKKLAKLEQMRDTTQPLTWKDFAEVEGAMMKVNMTGVWDKYKTVGQYDSAQKALPKAERDGWFKSRLARKEISINLKYGNDPKGAAQKLGQNVLYRLPYMLFVSLPLFAFILQLLYIRRKQFYYADHGVFTIHLYIFSFILLLVVFGLDELRDITGWGFINFVMVILFLGLNVYLYKAMRVFYGQRRLKTFIKYLLTALFSLLMMIVLLAIFFFFSAYDL